MTTEFKIVMFLLVAYVITLILVRFLLIKKGFLYSSCPSCRKLISRKKRNSLLKLAGSLTLNILSFRMVSCSKCEFKGVLLRRFRIL